jgi:hypothetical protein
MNGPDHYRLAERLLDSRRQRTSCSVASGMEVDEGRWDRSEGHIGSVKVRCKSAWLLHFAAAPPRRLGLGNLITQQRESGAAVPMQPGPQRQPPAARLRWIVQPCAFGCTHI